MHTRNGWTKVDMSVLLSNLLSTNRLRIEHNWFQLFMLPQQSLPTTPLKHCAHQVGSESPTSSAVGYRAVASLFMFTTAFRLGPRFVVRAVYW